jgi:transposase
MARSGPLLTEAQWKKIAPLLPKPLKQCKGGRPWIEYRRVLKGILWILRSGARWQDLPEKSPYPSTCWRRLRDWEGHLVAYLPNISERVKRAQAIEMERIISRRQFCSGKKRGCTVGKTKRGKGTKWMVVGPVSAVAAADCRRGLLAA